MTTKIEQEFLYQRDYCNGFSPFIYHLPYHFVFESLRDVFWDKIETSKTSISKKLHCLIILPTRIFPLLFVTPTIDKQLQKGKEDVYTWSRGMEERVGEWELMLGEGEKVGFIMVVFIVLVVEVNKANNIVVVLVAVS